MATSAPEITFRRRSLHDDDGVEGNELLTGLAGAMLLVPLAIEGVTILFIGQLIWLHMFVGMLLFGAIGLKLASTGYRFGGYYMGRAAYVRKGPPVTLLRLLAIPVVLSTVGVMATGLLLLLEGPGSPGHLLFLHKAFFIIWLAVTAIHVLAHLLDSYEAVQSDYGALPLGTPRTSRRTARLLAIAGGLVIGVIIALIAVPDFAAWQHVMVLRGHDG